VASFVSLLATAQKFWEKLAAHAIPPLTDGQPAGVHSTARAPRILDRRAAVDVVAEPRLGRRAQTGAAAYD
jgi:hypothetical protein